ncbi:Bax inhibitor-1/YccA family protein [Treponema zioleckii]|uniref:Bax inhibitor-1/YccA family protein n=1 Tax=Treponema zioleckii TaxID=331680 RepID=UPI001F5BF11D|nr:Bax inhibitor-1/YccA family protein [Treponema zioleckii]
MSVTAATVGFVVYSVLNGITLSSILFRYQLESIFAAFFSCSAMFLVMCIYGATTKRNLATVGRYCMMGLFGIVIATVVEFILSFFMAVTILDFGLAILTVIVFTGLTIYDAQKIQRVAENANGSDDFKKVAILAALDLYLDFINLFLALLRIFGKRR